MSRESASTPALCNDCGNVRDYTGKQEHFAFLKCEVCGKRTSHAIVGHEQTYVERTAERETLATQEMLVEVLYLEDLFRRLGYTVYDTDVLPYGRDSDYVPGSTFRVPRSQAICTHPDSTLEQRQTALRQLAELLLKPTANDNKIWMGGPRPARFNRT